MLNLSLQTNNTATQIKSRLLVLSSLTIALTGCDTFKHTLGLDHHQGDALKVDVNDRPLSLPPSYDLLPPSSETPADLESKNLTAQNKAKSIILGENTLKNKEDSKNSAPDQGKDLKESILHKAGKAEIDPGIKEKIEKEAETNSSENQTGILDKIISNAKNISNETSAKEIPQKS